MNSSEICQNTATTKRFYNVLRNVLVVMLFTLVAVTLIPLISSLFVYADTQTTSRVTLLYGEVKDIYGQEVEMYKDIDLDSGTDLTEYTSGAETVLPTDWKMDGYVFDGWYENEKLEGEPVTKIPSDANGDKTYYARWYPENEEKLTKGLARELYNCDFLTERFETGKNPYTYEISDTSKGSLVTRIFQDSKKYSEMYIGYYPRVPGTTTITLKKNGRIEWVDRIQVTEAYLSEYANSFVSNLNKDFNDEAYYGGGDIEYGEDEIGGGEYIGVELPDLLDLGRLRIIAKIGDKTYKGRVLMLKDGSGYYCYRIKLPKYKKLGTKVKVTISLDGKKRIKTFSYKKDSSDDLIKCSRIYRFSKKKTIKIYNAYKDDYVKIKIGNNKTITKRIKRSAHLTKLAVNFKPQQYGRTVKVTVYNRFKQKVRTKKYVVYFANKLRKGYTKSQVKYIPGWRHPSHKSVYGNYTTWYYDGYSRCVEFYNGRVTGWHR
jgi:uncharacterized repeat protein (TIGR02543 family)